MFVFFLFFYPLFYFFFFFFSSRRRHTRYIGDWSSDVCSSDLLVFASHVERPAAQPFGARKVDPRPLEPAHRARCGEPVLATVLRDWDRQDRRGLRLAG